jgi:2-polyprenyl-3-methyl-5-hydroxy-6-metoxy-1,4-benzoquinol methylase
MNNLASPITGLRDISLETTISVESIINAWKKWPGIDVTNYFGELNSISIYRCNKTGYRFYYPFHLAGDDQLYELLQNFNWYYVDSKWEYDEAIKLIKPQANVLEVGCGVGAFLKRLQLEKQSHAVGIELNGDAARKAIQNGFNVSSLKVEEYSKTHEVCFDVICAFQVLEHITDIRLFLNHLIKILKVGGYLIMAVPNNDSFIKHIPQHPLLVS